MSFDPSIRYTIWSILIGHSLSATAQYACLQTQAQRFMCVKNTKAAQKYYKNSDSFRKYFLIELPGQVMR